MILHGIEEVCMIHTQYVCSRGTVLMLHNGNEPFEEPLGEFKDFAIEARKLSNGATRSSVGGWRGIHIYYTSFLLLSFQDYNYYSLR